MAAKQIIIYIPTMWVLKFLITKCIYIPTVVMETKLHQQPLIQPGKKDGGNSVGLFRISINHARNPDTAMRKDEVRSSGHILRQCMMSFESIFLSLAT